MSRAPLALARGLLDCGKDAVVGAAAAEIATHRLPDLTVCRLRICSQQGRGRHDLAGLAVTALGNHVVDPRLLKRVRLTVAGKSLDSGDRLADSRGDGRDTRTSRHAVPPRK